MSREQIRAGLGEAAPAAFLESWIRFLRLVAVWSAKTSQNAPAAISESPKAVWRRPQLWGRAEAAHDCVDGLGYRHRSTTPKDAFRSALSLRVLIPGSGCLIRTIPGHALTKFIYRSDVLSNLARQPADRSLRGMDAVPVD
jgi:hypothetical protein